MPVVDRPIFIIGPHRSGTTLLYQILGSHEDAAYFTPLNKRLPAFPGLAHLLTGIVKPDYPVEAQGIWDRFKARDDDVMGPEEATPAVAAWYRRTVARVAALKERRRFVAKYPRLSLRVGWLDAIFPDAIFLHMTRDWRAVVNSTLQRKVKRERRGGGWFGVYIPGWPELEDLPHTVAAARVFRHVTLALEQEAARFDGRFFQVSYEALCRDPRETVRAVAERCGLSWSPAFSGRVPERLESANSKWRQHLDPELVAAVRAEDAPFFARYERD